MNKKCVIDIETESLDPKEGRIICIGIKGIGAERTIVFYNENEKQMIKDFLDYFHNERFREIIGYNVLFDIRFIFVKCLKYELASNGFFSAAFTDLLTVMKSVRRMYSYNKPGTLQEWVEFIFNDSKMSLDDSIEKLYEKGRITDILNYNKKDVELTFRMWERIEKVLNTKEGDKYGICGTD